MAQNLSEAASELITGAVGDDATAKYGPASIKEFKKAGEDAYHLLGSNNVANDERSNLSGNLQKFCERFVANKPTMVKLSALNDDGSGPRYEIGKLAEYREAVSQALAEFPQELRPFVELSTKVANTPFKNVGVKNNSAWSILFEITKRANAYRGDASRRAKAEAAALAGDASAKEALKGGTEEIKEWVQGRHQEYYTVLLQQKADYQKANQPVPADLQLKINNCESVDANGGQGQSYQQNEMAVNYTCILATVVHAMYLSGIHDATELCLHTQRFLQWFALEEHKSGAGQMFQKLQKDTVKYGNPARQVKLVSKFLRRVFSVVDDIHVRPDYLTSNRLAMIAPWFAFNQSRYACMTVKDATKRLDLLVQLYGIGRRQMWHSSCFGKDNWEFKIENHGNPYGNLFVHMMYGRRTPFTFTVIRTSIQEVFMSFADVDPNMKAKVHQIRLKREQEHPAK